MHSNTAAGRAPFFKHVNGSMGSSSPLMGSPLNAESMGSLDEMEDPDAELERMFSAGGTSFSGAENLRVPEKASTAQQHQTRAERGGGGGGGGGGGRLHLEPRRHTVDFTRTPRTESPSPPSSPTSVMNAPRPSSPTNPSLLNRSSVRLRFQHVGNGTPRDLDDMVRSALINILGFLPPEAFALISKSVRHQYLKAGDALFGPNSDYPHTAVLIHGTVDISFSIPSQEDKIFPPAERHPSTESKSARKSYGNHTSGLGDLNGKYENGSVPLSELSGHHHKSFDASKPPDHPIFGSSQELNVIASEASPEGTAASARRLTTSSNLLHTLTPGRIGTSLFTIIHELVNPDPSSDSPSSPSSPTCPKSRFTRPPHLVARAASDAFLAVVPAGTFARLAKTYPDAADQVLSVLASRITRVTLPFVRRYLGYSVDLLRIVQAVDVIAPDAAQVTEWWNTMEAKVERARAPTAFPNGNHPEDEVSVPHDQDQEHVEDSEYDDAQEGIVASLFDAPTGASRPNGQVRPSFASDDPPTPRSLFASDGRPPLGPPAVFSLGPPTSSLVSILANATIPLPNPIAVHIRHECMAHLLKVLQLPPDSLPPSAADLVTLHQLTPGATLIPEGRAFEGVCVVLAGEIVAGPQKGDDIFWTASRGAVIGAFSAVALSAAPVQWRAATGVDNAAKSGAPAWFAFLPNSVYLPLADRCGAVLRDRMWKFVEALGEHGGGAVQAVDMATEWRRYPAGATLTTQSAPAELVFKIVSGRIRVTVHDQDVADDEDVVDVNEEIDMGDRLQPPPTPPLAVPETAATRVNERTPLLTARGGIGGDGGTVPQSFEPNGTSSGSNQAGWTTSIPFRFGFPTFTVPTGWTSASYWGSLARSGSGNVSDNEGPNLVLPGAAAATLKLRSAFLLRPGAGKHDPRPSSSIDLIRRISVGSSTFTASPRRPSVVSAIVPRFLPPSDSVSGFRTRATSISELGFGATLGEIPLLIDRGYWSTCVALRDTHVAVLPKSFFTSAPRVFPDVSRAVSEVIAERAVQVEEAARSRGRDGGRSGVETGFSDPEGTVHVIGVVPVERRVPIADFAGKFASALRSEGSLVHTLDERDSVQLTGGAPTEAASEARLQTWLLNREYRGSRVLLVASGEPDSAWTKVCAQQADLVLYVCLGDGSPSLGEFEKELPPATIAVRKLLILLHQKREVRPGSTKEFLARRRWISRHFHIEMDSIPSTPEEPYLDEYAHRTWGPMMMPDFPLQLQLPDFRPAIDDFFAKLPEPIQANIQPLKMLWDINTGGGRDGHGNVSKDRGSDFARLARRLLNKSLGIVLGGGGAKGASHIGVLKALEERGIYPDFVAGTSIGALTGALLAKHGSLEDTTTKLRYFYWRMNSTVRMIMDLTLPTASFLKGKQFNQVLQRMLPKDLYIEDFWIPYFCNAVDITKSRHLYMEHGTAWRAVRAAMSIAALLPPAVDDNGNMLMDGGYFDLLPARAMQKFGASKVLAVDIGGLFDQRPVNRDTWNGLSGWTVLWQNIWGVRDPKFQTMPGLLGIESRIMFLTSKSRALEVKQMENVFYLRPPIDDFGTVDWSHFDRLIDVGANAAREKLQEWAKNKKAASAFGLLTK